MNPFNCLINQIKNKPVSESDLNIAAVFVLDAVVNSIAGAQTKLGRDFISWATLFSGNDLGRQAFIASANAHIYEADNWGVNSAHFLRSSVVPASIVTAVRENVSGPDLLRSVLFGVELMTRMDLICENKFSGSVIDSSVNSSAGTVISVAHLMGLSNEQTIAALGNTLERFDGIRLPSLEADDRQTFRVGRDSEAAVTAVQMAKVGIGSGEQYAYEFYGFSPRRSLESGFENSPWQATKISISEWSGSKYIKSVLDAVIELHHRFKEYPDYQLYELEIDVLQGALELTDRVNEHREPLSFRQYLAMVFAEGKTDISLVDENYRTELSRLSEKVTIYSPPFLVSDSTDYFKVKVMAKVTFGDNCRVEHTTRKVLIESCLNTDYVVSKSKSVLSKIGFDSSEANEFIDVFLHLKTEKTVPDVLNWVR